MTSPTLSRLSPDMAASEPQELRMNAQAVVERMEPATPVNTEAGGDSMVSMIERVILDQSIPLDRMERVLAMKERMEDRAREDEARLAQKAYFAAMSKCQAELPVVTKTRENTHTKSRYADLAAIEEQAMPIIHRHGFGVMFQPAGYNAEGELQIKWKITHEAGHSESDVAGVPVDNAGTQGKVNKTGTQAFGSTATYGRRYLLCMLFNISTGGDKDGNAPPSSATLTEAQIEEIKALIDKAVEARPGTDYAAWLSSFLEYMGVEALNDIPSKDFGKAKGEIENAIRQAGRK